MDNNKHDILTIADVELMVNSFYQKTQHDEFLGPVFNEHIADWDKHLPVMYQFWNSMLLASQTYKGNAFEKHAHLPINPTHFERWIDIFIENLDEHFAGEVTERAKFLVKNVAMNFQIRLGLNLSDEQIKKYQTS
ncbi:MAG: group III truncated hemoglobin [Bacteroidota bacterium]